MQRAFRKGIAMTKKPADAVADEAPIKAPAEVRAQSRANSAPRMTEEQRQKLVMDIAKALQAHGIGFTVWHNETPNQTIH